MSLSPTFERCAPTVLEAIEDGCSIVDAARVAGCAPRTVDRWLGNGRADPSGPYGPFAAAVDGCHRARGLPDEGQRERLSYDELLAIISRAARSGSVPAMRLAAEVLAPDIRREPDVLDRLQERRAARLEGRSK